MSTCTPHARLISTYRYVPPYPIFAFLYSREHECSNRPINWFLSSCMYLHQPFEHCPEHKGTLIVDPRRLSWCSIMLPQVIPSNRLFHGSDPVGDSPYTVTVSPHKPSQPQEASLAVEAWDEVCFSCTGGWENTSKLHSPLGAGNGIVVLLFVLCQE